MANSFFRMGQNYAQATSGTAARIGPFGNFTQTIRIATGGSAIRFAVGNSTVTATATDILFPPNWSDFFNVSGGQYISVIQDSAAGSVTITEVTQ